MFLGIDGGGTRCRARLVDPDGRSLGEGFAGSANLTLGVAVALASVRTAAEAAFLAAGVPPSRQPETRAGLGLAGANVPALAAAVLESPLPFASVAVASDAVAACLGAHGGRDGGILILGTGSQGLAIVDGRATTLGGWGFALSDDASGAVVGRSLLRAAIAAREGLGPASPLTDAVLAGFGNDPGTAVLWAASATPAHYGVYAPALFEAAAAGDRVAAPIVRAAAAQVDAMLERLGELGARRIALVGGLADVYRPWLDRRSTARLVAPEGDAMAGAIRLARDGAPA